MKTTKDLKVTFLGVNPVLTDKTGSMDPQSICALSALLTFKGKSVQNLKQESIDKGQDLNKKIQAILRKSSLRGHASMATTPVFSFSYEASKFLDSALTGVVFSSSLMASGRRTDTTYEDIVYPTTLEKNKQAQAIYDKASKKIIDVSNWMLEKGVEKDQASKILQYGIYGTGIISYSVESLNSIKREYEREKEWMPEEIGMLLVAMEEEMKKMGVSELFHTRAVAPRNTLPYPNIFKNPRQSNLVRDRGGKLKLGKETTVIEVRPMVTSGLKQRLDGLKKRLSRMYESKAQLKKDWYDALEERASIARDYMHALDVTTLARISWRTWGEKKRHRTAPMTVDSVYYTIGRAYKTWKKYARRIDDKKYEFSKKDVAELDGVLTIPPAVKASAEYTRRYVEACWEGLEAYKKLIAMKIPVRDAVFVIPRAIRIDMIQQYNFFNLIAGYYPLRLCTKAEEQLRRVTKQERDEIEKKLKALKLDWLLWHIQPKCYNVGYCPEEQSCYWLKKDVKYYDEKTHEEMKIELDKKYQESLGVK